MKKSFSRSFLPRFSVGNVLLHKALFRIVASGDRELAHAFLCKHHSKLIGDDLCIPMEDMAGRVPEEYMWKTRRRTDEEETKTEMHLFESFSPYEDLVQLADANVRHVKARRIGPKSKVTLIDGEGNFAIASLEPNGNARVETRLFSAPSREKFVIACALP